MLLIINIKAIPIQLINNAFINQPCLLHSYNKVTTIGMFKDKNSSKI